MIFKKIAFTLSFLAIVVFAISLLMGKQVLAAALVSDGIDHVPEPTHCAFYFNSDVISHRTATVPDDEGYPMCFLNLDFVQPGTHVIRASFQIDNGVWGIEEGPLSDPFEFTRPVGAESLPAPILRIDLSGNIGASGE